MQTGLEQRGGHGGRSWDAGWLDYPPKRPPRPLPLDVLAVLKGGNRFASYLFAQETSTGNPTTASGTWAITYTNQGGQRPSLSHLSLYYRKASHSSTSSGGGAGNGVPEPGVLWLAAAGLLGLTLARRRR